MQEHVRANDLHENPRPLLLGEIRARIFFIAASLLQWYFKQGLQVTRIHEVIEYVPGMCFRDFYMRYLPLGDKVATMNIIVDTKKLIGRSHLGSVQTSTCYLCSGNKRSKN